VSCFSVTAVGGKDTKDKKGVWKLLRESDLYLTKDEPDGGNQVVLGYGRRMLFLRKQLLQVFAGSGNILSAVSTMETSGYAQIIWALNIYCKCC